MSPLPLLLSVSLLVPLGTEGDYPRHSGHSCERVERFAGDKEGSILGEPTGEEVILSLPEDSTLSPLLSSLGFASREDRRDALYFFPRPSCGSRFALS